MNQKTEFDHEAAHKYFSVACFNKAWDLIDKADRTSKEDEDMIRLSMASHWHWTQRADYGLENASIAYWQMSRIYAILGRVDDARSYGQLCLEASLSGDVGAFYLGYAYEALARAESAAGNDQEAVIYLENAKEVVAKVTDADEAKILQGDLDSIIIN